MRQLCTLTLVLGLLLAFCGSAQAVIIGDPTVGVTGVMDGWGSNMVVDEGRSYQNTSGLLELISPDTFTFAVGSNRSRVTPFIVQLNDVNGNGDYTDDNNFTLLRIGTTRISGVDYNSTGVFSYDFGGAGAFTLEPGAVIAAAFIDADPDGTGGEAGSVIPYAGGIPAGEQWYHGNSGATHQTSFFEGLTFGGAPDAGVQDRNYEFHFDISAMPAFDAIYTWGGAASGDWGTGVWNSDTAGFPPPNAPVDDATHTILAVIDTAGANVNVEANHSAVALQVPQGQLTIGAGNTLSITGEVDVAGTVAFGSGAGLVAGGGAAIGAVVTNGSNTIDAGSDVSVGSWTDGAAAGTFTKAGEGTLSLDNTGGTVDLNSTALKVSGGTLALFGPNPLGGSTAPIQLDGGVFQISGTKDPTPDPGMPAIAGLQLHLDAAAIQGLADGATVSQWDDISGNGNHATLSMGNPIYRANANGDGSAAVEFGEQVIGQGAGMVTPLTVAGDDYSIFIVFDSDQNSSAFRRAIHGSNNWLIGPYQDQLRYHNTGWAYIGPAMPVDQFVVAEASNSASAWAFYENGVERAGGAGSRGIPGQLTLGADNRPHTWTPERLLGDIAEVLVFDSALSESDRNLLNFHLQQKYGTGPLGPLNMTGTDFVVTQDSTIDAVTASSAAFGQLTLQNGIVTTTGAAGTISFTGTTIAPAATRVGIAPDSTTDYGSALTGRPGLTFALGGSGDKTLVAAYVNPGDLALANMTDATIEVAGGTTSIDSKSLLAGSTNLLLSGGTMRLAAPIAVPGADPGAVTAGMAIRYDASNGVTSDAAGVTTWANTAPGADATYIAVADSVPPVWVDNAFNGNAVVRFDGTDQQRLSFLEYMDMESVLWVLRENEGATGRAPLLGAELYFPFNRQTGRGPMFGGWSSPEVRGGDTTLNDTPVVGTVEPPPTELGVVGLVLTGPLTQQDAHLGPSNGITTGIGQIGQDRDQDGRSWDGDFADIIIYDRQLTAAEMSQMTQHLAFRYSIPVEQSMEDFSGVDMTVTADSTLNVGGQEDVDLASLTLRGGTLITSGSAASINFTGVTVDVDPASDMVAGLNAQTTTTYGAGPLQLNHGVIKTTGTVTFNGVSIPNSATDVGFNPGAGTTYGTIQANNTSAVISKTGPGVMVLNPGDIANLNSNATLEARGGTLAIGGSGGFAGAGNALLNGGTMRIHAGALSDADVKQMSMVGAWLFDEGSGNVAGNSAGGGDGAIAGAVWVDDFDRGSVLKFVDAAQVVVGAEPFATVNDAITIAFWQYGDELIQPQNNTIFQAQIGSQGRAFGSHLPWGDSNLYWDAGGTSGCCNDRSSFALDPADFSGQWNHYAYTKDINTGLMKVFINGEERHSAGGRVRALGGVTQFFIGSEGNTNYYDGMIDEFLVYNRALDGTEVEDLFNNGVSFAALPAISMTDRDFTVASDSTLHAASDTTAAFGGLMLEGGTVAITGAPDGVSFTSLTVNAPGSEGGVNLGTSATFGAGPVSLQAGVLKTEGEPVTFNGVNIPVGASAVGLNPISQTTYGGINGNLMSGTVAKTGPGKLSLASGDAAGMTNATWVAQDGTLEMVGAASWAGSTNATLAGGTLVLTNVEAVVTPIDPGTIGSLELRLDAGEIGLGDGDTVFVWPDSSGFGRDATNTRNDPIYVADGLNGQPVVRFTDDQISTDVADNFDTILDDYTIVSVARYTGGDNERIISSRNHNWLFGYHGNLDERWYAEGWIFQGGLNNTTEWNLHAGTMSTDATASMWKNGNLVGAGATGANATNNKPGQLSLGGHNTNEFSNAEIAEVLIFNGVLTDEQLTGIGIFLEQKYGLDTAYRGEVAALSLTDRDITVEADSTLHARTDFTAALGALTLKEGVATIVGAPGGVSFTSTTLPAGAGTSGITTPTAVTGGPLTINAGVLRTRGPVTFDATTIPVAATAVGFDTDADVDLGVISAAGQTVIVSKSGPGVLLLTETNTGLQNATWNANGGTLTLAGAQTWGGATEVRLSGGTIGIRTDPIADPNGLGANLVGAWLFDEGAGTIAADSTGNGDGTIMGSASWVNDAQRGWVLDFEGDAQVAVPGGPFATINEAVTVAFWQFGDEAIQPQNNTIFQAKIGGARAIGSHLPWSNSNVYWDAGGASSCCNDRSILGLLPEDFEGQWNHWAFTKDTNTGLMKVFINGVERHSAGGRTRLLGGIDRMFIGSEENLNYYDGMIDEFVLFDRALNLAEVNELMNDGAPVDTLVAIAMTDKNFTVTGNSTLNAMTSFDAAFGTLSMENGVLTTSGAKDGISFTSTTIAPWASTVGFNPATATSLGPLDGSNATATISKTGGGDLVLTDAGTNLGNATFSADGGRLITMGTSPIGDASLQTGGGELVLPALAGSSSPVLYDKAITGAGGTLTAGKGGQAGTADAPMTVQVGSAGVNGVTVPEDKSLRLRSTDNYTLDVVGNFNAQGEVIVDDASSMIVLSGPSPAIGSLSVADGTANLTGATATIGQMTTTGGTTTLAGANTNVGTMTVKGGTVSTAGNDVGVTSLKLGSHSYKVAGGSMAVRGSDLLSDGSVVVGGGTLTIAGTAALPVANPLAYYSFNDAGNVTNDDSGNGYTGTLIAPAAANAEGKFGGSLFLNTGTARQGQMRVNPSGINLDQGVTDEWTVAAWYWNLAPVGDWRTFMRGQSTDHHIIVQNNADNLGAYVAGFRDSTADLLPDPDVWHHIAAVGSPAGTTIYVDGVQVGQIPQRASDNVYAIGGYQNNSQRFAEKLDEVLIYGRALSAAEVAQLMDPAVDSVDQDSTSLVITGNATVTTTAAEAVLGNLTVDSGVTTVNLENALYAFNNASIADGVTVTGEMSVRGTLNVGNSAGTVTVDEGELVFDSSAGSTPVYNAEVSLGGSAAAITADKIVITGSSAIHLDGTLAPKGIGRTNSDFFSVGTSLTVVDNTAGGVLTGVAGDTPFEFASVDPAPAADVSAHIGQGAFLRDVTYDRANGFVTTAVDLDVFVALGGDTDGDKKVWLSDWAALRANFGNTATDKTWTDGNFDPWVDGKVWLSDWAALRANFGNVDYTTAEAGAAAVPEPGTIAMLLAALAGLAAVAWRRR